jgi:hypothetical protein
LGGWVYKAKISGLQVGTTQSNANTCKASWEMRLKAIMEMLKNGKKVHE